MELNDKIVIYQTSDGNTSIEVKLENDTVWLSANQMASLFGRDEKTIRKHINNVFSEGELIKESNTHFLRIANSDKPVAFYTQQSENNQRFLYCHPLEKDHHHSFLDNLTLILPPSVPAPSREIA